MNPEHKKHEENGTIINVLQTSDKEKIFKAARAKSLFSAQSRDKGIGFLTGTKASAETVQQHLERKKENASLDFYTRQESLFKDKGIIRTFLDVQKMRESTTSRPALHEKNSLGRRKMIPVGSLDLHKGKKDTRNGNYMDKYVRLCSFQSL